MEHLFSEDFFKPLILGCFCAATLIQMAYFFGAWRAFSTLKVYLPDASPPACSVILCARNEAEKLRQNLPAILAQDYPGQWELLVVDDASTDETPALLANLSNQNKRLKTVRINHKTHPGKKQALQTAVASAAYPLVLCTDADCMPNSTRWLQGMMAAFKDEHIAIVLGYAPLTGGRGAWSDWNRIEAAHTALTYITFAQWGQPYMGVGRNMAFKKSLFLEHNNWSKHWHQVSGDDDLFVNAAANCNNTAVCLDPDTFMASPGKASFSGWWRQKRRHLGAGIFYRKRHRWMLAILALSLVLHYFLALLLFFLDYYLKYVVFLCLFRCFICCFSYKKAYYFLGASKSWFRFPIHDALLAVYYGVFVPIIIIGKKTQAWS